MLARAGCGGRIFDASRGRRKVFRIRKSLRDMLAIIVIEESILGKVTDSSSLCSSE